MDTLADDIEQKIAELNSQLIDYKNRMEKLRDCPSPSKKMKKQMGMMKQAAIRLLKRKRLYQHQVKSLRTKSLKMKQAENVPHIHTENIDAKADVTKIKKVNLLPEKLRLLYKKMVQQNK